MIGSCQYDGLVKDGLLRRELLADRHDFNTSTDTKLRSFWSRLRRGNLPVHELMFQQGFCVSPAKSEPISSLMILDANKKTRGGS